MKTPLLSSLIPALALAGAAFAQPAGKSVLAGGNFEASGSGWEYVVQGWKRTGYWGGDIPPNDVKQVTERGNAFVRVISGAGLEKGTVLAVLEEKILLKPEWKNMIVRFRSRLPDLETGLKKWQTARVQLEFFDETGASLKLYPSVNVEPSGEWVKTQGVINIPPAARSFAVQFGFWGALGTLDLDDLELVPAAK